jgi:hypothetical protein
VIPTMCNLSKNRLKKLAKLSKNLVEPMLLVNPGWLSLSV